MIFVDTGAWFTLAVREDQDHAAAVDWFDRNEEPLATSDLVVVETMNLIRFRSRGPEGHRLSCRFGDDLWEQKAAILVRVTPEDIELGRKIFRKYRDKVWSFTDCTSFAVMKRLSVSTAFSFDRNFEQFPGIGKVP